jgi:hypothetical protein
MGRYIRAISGQRLSKPVSVALQQILNSCNNLTTTMEDLCFLYDPCIVVISKGQRQLIVGDVGPRMEAGSNTSSVTLRVVGGDEKRSLKSETVKYGRESQGTRTRERLRW